MTKQQCQRTEGGISLLLVNYSHYYTITYLGLARGFNSSGALISMSRVLTTAANLGRAARSSCQHSNISSYIDSGQSWTNTDNRIIFSQI